MSEKIGDEREAEQGGDSDAKPRTWQYVAAYLLSHIITITIVVVALISTIVSMNIELTILERILVSAGIPVVVAPFVYVVIYSRFKHIKPHKALAWIFGTGVVSSIYASMMVWSELSLSGYRDDDADSYSELTFFISMAHVIVLCVVLAVAFRGREPEPPGFDGS